MSDPEDRWRKWGDRKERRRLQKEGLWYDPNSFVSGDILTEELKVGVPWLPGRNPVIGAPIITPTYMFCKWLASAASPEIVPESETNCTTYAKHVADTFRWFANNHGGGRMSVGLCRANKVNWHLAPPPHAFVLARTSDDGIWVIDTAFHGGTINRFFYKIVPDDRDFWGFEL